MLSLIYLFYTLGITKALRGIISKFLSAKDKRFETVEKTSRFKEIDDITVHYNEMVTELDYYVERLHDIAYFDSLTKIPSKQKARDEFEELSKVFTVKHCMIYIDIHRFRIINDNYGYDFGDQSLMIIAKVLEKELPNVYRIEGDEFLAYIDMNEINDFEDFIAGIESKITYQLHTSGYPVDIKLKCGISQYQKDGTTFAELFKKSVIACESVQDIVTKNYGFYNEVLSDKYVRNSRIEMLIPSALKNKEFTTVYQPIIDIKTQKIRGFEALSRWKNEDFGVVNPDEFIPILEKRKEVYKLDSNVLLNAVKLVKFIQTEYGINLIASVNISVETIMRDDFIDMVTETLLKFNINPHLLELEITESTIIVDFNKITKKMDYLRGLGVKFSEDDFGDAYSSLTYLSRLKIDTLKISKNFLSTILTNVESKILIKTILDLSKNLGFFTIVEGVETKEVFELFKKYGCDYAQGYLFYKPMDEEKLIDILNDIIEEDSK
jgi:diguanylate cyclase (GGDEF)-like protein